ETHYSAGRLHLHQPWEYGRRSAAHLLAWLGFSKVHRDEQETVTAATPAQVPGYVLTRGADLYGRCVALAGRAEPPGPGGKPIQATAAMLRRTVNYDQLRRGLAYPTYYRKLYVDLREAMTLAVERARPGTGLWSLDETGSGALLAKGMSSLTD